MAATSTNVTIDLQTVAYLSVGDYVVFENYQDANTTIVTFGEGEQYTTFSAVLLGA
jgi:predicted amino acid racemase